jgi:hypothetical protein
MSGTTMTSAGDVPISFDGGVATARQAALAGQVAFVVGAWVLLCALGWGNDGLWFQGDAPRHAANGVFWKDYLVDRPADLRDYALRYYARYPVTHLSSYPPLFYLVEAGGYALIGVSPHVIKPAVLFSTLVAALYSLAWIRRWIEPDAGWAAAVVLLQPIIVQWSHAIMLNVPAFTVMLAALYHTNRSLESTEKGWHGHEIASIILLMTAVLVYYPAGIALLIAAAWIVQQRRWRRLWSRNFMIFGALVVVVAFAAAPEILQWAPRIGRWLNPAHVMDGGRWLFYPTHINGLVSPHVAVLAGIGAVVGLATRTSRRQTVLLIIWVALTYVVLSYIDVQSERYILPLAAPLVFLCTISLTSAARWSHERGWRVAKRVRVLIISSVIVLAVVQVRLIEAKALPSVEGFRAAAQYLERVAPNEPVLYHGYYDGVLMFYLLAGDPQFQRGVVLARKVVPELDAQLRGRPYAAASALREILRTRTGCRWIVLEKSLKNADPLSRRLFSAVEAAEIERVRSFPVTGTYPVSLEVYRWRESVESPQHLDIVFPDLDENMRFKVVPMGPRVPPR